ncbi:hypothetical protein MBLNU230_g5693t1 [Neophaeotheca triangularis]
MASQDDAASQTRGSGGSGSGRTSSSSKSKQNPQQQLSTIEKSVTHLLVATKQLLETLTHWSRGSATESEVSDVYVRLGYEFNIACRAFNAIGVDTSDLGPVPDLLRGILEDTLSQEASQQSLDKFLPRIRDIIINLLHGLKKKQQRLRQRTGSSREGGDSRPPRQGSTASNNSLDSNLTQQLEDVPTRASSARTYAQRQGSNDMAQPDLPPRTTSVPTGRASPRRQEPSPQNSIHRQSMSREKAVNPDSDSTLSSNAMQNIPVIAPYPETDTMPSNQGYEQDQPSPTPPRPPPKQNDALTALQKGGDLERRASRRFSAYQIQKHLGTSVNGMPTIPPAQNSPIPNRGRDVRESMNAVRTRGSVLHSRARSRHQREYEASPGRDVRRISEEPGLKQDETPVLPKPKPADEDDDSPMAKTPEDKLASYPFPETGAKEVEQAPAATTNGPVEEPFTPNGSYQSPPSEKTKTVVPSWSRQAQAQTSQDYQFMPESSPQPGKELTLFLQYKSKIKKFVLPDGADLTVPRLQLAFIEKFAWNTHSNGNDLPEIYIQDPVSGVRHELEDLSDIKERSVLVLNVEALDEVKRHIDDGIGGLRRVIEDIRTSVDGQQTALQRVSDRQQEAAKEMATLTVARPETNPTPTNRLGRKTSLKDPNGQLTEVQSLRRDLAVVRQTYTTFVSDMTASMDTVRSKASAVKYQAATATVPDIATSPDNGRSYVNAGKKSLSDDSEVIVSRVDDLQDIVEDLRKDVVTRGVRPLPRQLETVSKDISTATSELKKLQEFLKREKPVWTKIWERELQVVCDDREILTMQEELAADLEDDLEKAAQTFALVEQATKQQNLANQNGPGGAAGAAAGGSVVAGTRTPSGKLNPVAFDRGADPHKAKDGVLGEVRALQPNHESRLEAIERAERARRRELEGRRDGAFQKELGSFVQEGKLKKSGGVEEVERVRIVREERARKEWADLQARRREERARKVEGEAAPAPAPVDNSTAESTAEARFEEDGMAQEGESETAAAETNGDATEGSLEVSKPESTERASQESPEPVFVEAKEDVVTPKEEKDLEGK